MRIYRTYGAKSVALQFHPDNFPKRKIGIYNTSIIRVAVSRRSAGGKTNKDDIIISTNIACQ